MTSAVFRRRTGFPFFPLFIQLLSKINQNSGSWLFTTFSWGVSLVLYSFLHSETIRLLLETEYPLFSSPPISQDLLAFVS